MIYLDSSLNKPWTYDNHWQIHCVIKTTVSIKIDYDGLAGFEVTKSLDLACQVSNDRAVTILDLMVKFNPLNFNSLVLILFLHRKLSNRLTCCTKLLSEQKCTEFVTNHTLKFVFSLWPKILVFGHKNLSGHAFHNWSTFRQSWNQSLRYTTCLSELSSLYQNRKK